MGILNATPDSFSDGGRFDNPSRARLRVAEMAAEGADVIDVGGESTRPGHVPVDIKTELHRVTGVLEALRGLSPCPPLSIDTTKAAVAAAALEQGAAMLNDQWGLQRDPGIAEVAASFRVPVTAMFNADVIDRESDVIDRLKRFFDRSLSIAVRAGIAIERVVLDPGIGFGKTAAQNVEVLRRLSELKALGQPMLLGTSRKSFIGRILHLPADQRMEGTLATSILAVAAGIDMLRVHDVEAHVRAIRVADTIVRNLPIPAPA